MDFEKQKPVSEEYKRNWERIYQGGADSSRDSVRGDGERTVARQGMSIYENGCPILEEK